MKSSTGGYHQKGEGKVKHRSGGHKKGYRAGFNCKVVFKGNMEVPIGEFRFAGVSRVGPREFVIESADSIG